MSDSKFTINIYNQTFSNSVNNQNQNLNLNHNHSIRNLSKISIEPSSSIDRSDLNLIGTSNDISLDMGLGSNNNNNKIKYLEINPSPSKKTFSSSYENSINLNSNKKEKERERLKERESSYKILKKQMNSKIKNELEVLDKLNKKYSEIKKSYKNVKSKRDNIQEKLNKNKDLEFSFEKFRSNLDFKDIKNNTKNTNKINLSTSEINSFLDNNKSINSKSSSCFNFNKSNKTEINNLNNLKNLNKSSSKDRVLERTFLQKSHLNINYSNLIGVYEDEKSKMFTPVPQINKESHYLKKIKNTNFLERQEIYKSNSKIKKSEIEKEKKKEKEKELFINGKKKKMTQEAIELNMKHKLEEFLIKKKMKDLKIEENKRKKEEEEIKKCTFKPKILDTSKKIIRNRNKSMMERNDNITMDDKSVFSNYINKEKKEKKEKKENNVNNFNKKTGPIESGIFMSEKKEIKNENKKFIRSISQCDFKENKNGNKIYEYKSLEENSNKISKITENNFISKNEKKNTISESIPISIPFHVPNYKNKNKNAKKKLENAFPFISISEKESSIIKELLRKKKEYSNLNLDNSFLSSIHNETNKFK
jgi:hypothetical protein